MLLDPLIKPSWIIFPLFIATTCGSDQFECTSGICKYTDNENCSGKCVRGDWFQDGEEDCTDGSDEGEWLHSLNSLNKSNAQILVRQIFVQNLPNNLNLIGRIWISTNQEPEIQIPLQSWYVLTDICALLLFRLLCIRYIIYNKLWSGRF